MFFHGGNPLTPFLFLAVLDTIISLLGFDPCLFKSSRNCSTSVLSFFSCFFSLVSFPGSSPSPSGEVFVASCCATKLLFWNKINVEMLNLHRGEEVLWDQTSARRRMFKEEHLFSLAKGDNLIALSSALLPGGS